MKKTLLFKRNLVRLPLVAGVLLIAGSSNAQMDTVTIGTATTTTTGSGESPFGTFWHDNKNQILFTQADLNAQGFYGGFIHGMAFNVSSVGSPTMQNFEVQMKHTSATVVSAWETGFTTMYTTNLSPTTGWNYFNFAAPFLWDGISNVLVQTCFNNTSYTTSSGVYYTNTSTATNGYGYSDSSVPDPCSSEPYDGASIQRPNTRFIVAPPYTLDAGIIAIDSPAVPACNLGNNVWATLGCFGTDTLTSATINWTKNGVAQTPLSWTGSLAYGETLSIMVGSTPIIDGDIVKVWSTNPNGGTEPAGAQLNDTTSQLVKEGLSGTYFITCLGLPSTYLTFNDAVADLIAYGVCGPTTFVVDACTYNERVVIPEIQNASATNTIRFTGLAGQTSSVILTYSPSGLADNGTLVFDGADYIQFDHMTIKSGATGTYTSVIEYNNGACHNTFDSLNVLGNPSSNTTSYYASCFLSYGGIDTNNVISNNNINGGSYSYYTRGNSTVDQEMNNTYTNNMMTDYYYMGGYSYYTRNFEESYNTAIPDSVTFYTFGNYGFYHYYSDGQLKFHHNKAVVDQYGYGAFFGSCNGAAAQPGYIYNNSLSVGDPNSTSTTYALYLTGCSNQMVHSNSVNVSSNGTLSRALYVTGGGNVNVLNNNFVNDGPGYGMYILSGIGESDYNNSYAPNGYYGYAGGNQTTLTDFQNATATDAHSVSADPMFPAFDDLSTCNDTLDLAGIADTLVTDDVLGHGRSTIPDIGAYEFDGIAKFSVGADTSICSTDCIILGNPVSYSSWLWTTGANTNTITVCNPGTYIAQISNACGVGLDTMTLMNLPDPLANFSSSTSYYTGIFTDNSIAADTYLWDFGDGTTSTDPSPLHLFPATGWYDVSLTITGICGTHTFSDSVFIFINSIDEVETIEFNLYPNPADDNITMTSTVLLGNAKLEVLDATGRVVLSRNVNGSSIGLNIQALEAGPYFVRITENGKTSTQRLIVK